MLIAGILHFFNFLILIFFFIIIIFLLLLLFFFIFFFFIFVTFGNFSKWCYIDWFLPETNL